MTKESFISGIDDAYLDGVKRWQEKKQFNNLKKENAADDKRKQKLTSCKTCAREVARTAKTCPHCGETLSWGWGKKLIASIIIAPVALMILAQLNGPYVPVHDTSEAQVITRQAITSRLKDPDSYKEIQNKVTEENGNKLVFIEYTATNSFNARVRGAAVGIVDQAGKLVAFKGDFND